MNINKSCMARFTHVTIWLLMLIICGCEKDDSVGLTDSDLKIESDVKIKMWETMDSTSRTLQFHCSTEKEYGCSNYVINRTFNHYSTTIDIDFKGIHVPDMCLTSIGPATTTIDLATLSNGTYPMNIKVGKKNSTGQLVVTADSYAVSFNNQQQLQVTNSPLYRVPANTIWGTIGYHTTSTAPHVQSFIDSLLHLGATNPTYQSGDYGYFKINSSGQILPPENHGYWFVRPFIFEYSGNSADLKTLIENFSTYYGNSLYIFLYTTKGEVFRN